MLIRLLLCLFCVIFELILTCPDNYIEKAGTNLKAGYILQKRDNPVKSGMSGHIRYSQQTKTV